MSVWVASAIGAAYVGGVVGLHRLNVWRQRSAARGFPPLAWLDWDTLLQGLLPKPATAAPAKAPQPVEGGPPTPSLGHAPAPEAKARHELLCALVTGHRLDEAAFENAGFSGGEAQWLTLLSRIREEPEEVLDKLDDAATLETAAQVYLREHLYLTLRVHPFNLELAVFGTKRRLMRELDRFPEVPALHFVRAKASSLIGFNGAVLDDLARAVYFSRQSLFYLRVVVDMPWVGEARPALLHQCRAALAQAPKLG
ncbi:MAG: hypothetical protein JNK82_32055 [Myxococcaceae bacterium]|nr:hypothetical protein [Myxococcaceae bacterium]